MTEDELLDGLVGAAASGGWLTTHVRGWHPGIIQGRVGYPDITAVHPGRGLLVFIECKSASGRLDEAQERWILALRAAGADARVVRPADYDATVLWLLGDRALEYQGRRIRR